jgi:hypothetical protein
VLHDDFAASLLEKERSLLHAWVKLAINKDACFEVLLGTLAQDFVLTHNTLVGVANKKEVFLARVLIAPYLVVHD